jgi:hypothetical protein
MGYLLPAAFFVAGAVGLLVLEQKRLDAAGEPILRWWAERNGYLPIRAGLRMSLTQTKSIPLRTEEPYHRSVSRPILRYWFHDGIYVRSRPWWRIRNRARYNVLLSEDEHTTRSGSAVCDLSTGEVTVAWHERLP